MKVEEGSMYSLLGFVCCRLSFLATRHTEEMMNQRQEDNRKKNDHKREREIKAKQRLRELKGCRVLSPLTLAIID